VCAQTGDLLRQQIMGGKQPNHGLNSVPSSPIKPQLNYSACVLGYNYKLN
jgi:hypothetical protein